MQAWLNVWKHLQEHMLEVFHSSLPEASGTLDILLASVWKHLQTHARSVSLKSC